MVAAAHALGRPYSLTGTVVRGAGHGHRLGFPTANLEVGNPDKLFDFADDVYGDRIRVDFIARIRDIARFESVDALIHAMEADCENARALLAG